MYTATAETGTELARRIWAATTAAPGTLVETYLNSRAIKARVPDSIRFGTLRYRDGRYLPAMVAAVTVWPSTEPVAIHRTFLRGDGSGKAEVDDPKLSLGPIRGGAIRLGPVGAALVVAEGIETALSCQQETGMPSWAAISAYGLPTLVLPTLPLAAEVVIAADHDATGLRKAHEAARIWQAEGRKVRIALPPAGLDFNDVLQQEARLGRCEDDA